MRERDVRWDGKGYGFVADGKLYLVRCPKCQMENYAMVVDSGRCAWCGEKPEIPNE